MAPISNSFIETHQVQGRDLGAAWAAAERRQSLVPGVMHMQTTGLSNVETGREEKTETFLAAGERNPKLKGWGVHYFYVTLNKHLTGQE